MTILAAVDCGINSLRLLISRVEVVNGVLEITELHRLMEIVCLDQGVDATGTLAPEMLEHTREALMKYTELIQVEKARAARMVAASATRNASNRSDFFAMTHETLASQGMEAEVITEEREAALSLHDTVDDLESELSPYCVIDVGNGSTEAIVSDCDGTVVGFDSVAMDSTRLTECFLQPPSPTVEQVQRVCSHVAELTDEIVWQMPANKARTIVGCVGTFITLSALAQGLETYNPEAIHLSQLCFTALRALAASVAEADVKSFAANPIMHLGRTDVLAGGSIIVDGLMDMFGTLSLSEVAKEERRFSYINEKDILDGIVVSLVDTHIVH